jgi:hypothetical protein
MILPPQDTERFYRIWWALLSYVNARRKVIPGLRLPDREATVSVRPEDAYQLRQILWAEDPLREQFVAQNPANLAEADLRVVDSWQHRLSSRFFVVRHLKRYSVFLQESPRARAYGVVGLVSPLEEVVGPYLPVLVEAVLLPFEGRVIYDSLLFPYNIVFGSGIRRSLETAYRQAREREGVITSLVPAGQPLEPAQLRAGNARLLNAFRRELYSLGLSTRMVEQHIGNAEAFAEAHLLIQEQPRMLLDITAEDLENYLSRATGAAKKPSITSLTRLVRFLYNTGRADPDSAREMYDVLKLHRRGG